MVIEIMRSKASGVSPDDVDELLELAGRLEYVVLEYCRELVLDVREECHDVQGVQPQVSTQVRLERHLLQVHHLHLVQDTEDAGLYLGINLEHTSLV